MKSNRSSLNVILLCAALVGLALFAFEGALDCGFVFDDGVYILDNIHVHRGLTYRSAQWAFTTFYAGNWHPLTWLSHQADVSLYGLNKNSMGHHLTSVLLHAVNAVLLFLALRAATGSTWRSAVVAAVWTVHPLRLESVAWVSERKDVLSAFFWLLSMLAYVRYARRPSAGTYVLLLVLFAAGLMAKPMLVTLPLALLVLDYWPLGRCRVMGHGLQQTSDTRPPNPDTRHPVPGPQHPTPIARLILEKLPLLLMALGSCAVTLLAQRGWGNVSQDLPFGARAANAAVSYVAYVRKMLWPSNLAAYYPHPGTGIPVWQVVACAALLAAATYLSIRVRRHMPHVSVGWFWYLMTLVPVIGIVQVGDQAMADRYTYLPMIGILMVVVWSLPEPSRTFQKIAIALPAVAILALLSAQTRHDSRCWSSDEALFTRALQVTRDNWVAHYGLARALGTRLDHKSAEFHAREALRLNPDSLDARMALGVALTRGGKASAAVAELRRVVEADPQNVLARLNLASALNKAGEAEMARREVNEAFGIDHEQARRIIARYARWLELPSEWLGL